MNHKFALFLVCLFLYSQNTFSQNRNQGYKYQKIIRVANSYYAQKDYTKSLEKYEEALGIIGTNRIDLYNTACTASLLDKTVKANDYLRRSIENGYIDLEWIEKDTDFDNLRKTKYWEENIKLLKSRFQSIENDFAAIKDFQLHNLVPFKKDGNWGYMDKETLKMVVPSNYYQVSFGGNCLHVGFTQNNNIIVDENGVVKISRPRMNFPPPPPPPYYPNTIQIDSSENFKGFKVNKKGKISHVSSIYEANPEPVFMDMDIDEDAFMDVGTNEPVKEIQKVDIFGPFKINNNWHAITIKNGKYGVIDESGNELESVGFKFRKLSRIKQYKGNDILFSFKDSLKKKGFIDSKGEVKFYDEFDNWHLNPISKHRPNYYIFMKKGLWAILDLSTLEWVIPFNQLKRIRTDFSYEGDCNDRHNFMRPVKILDCYLLVKDKDGNEFYLGENNVRYQIK